MTGPDGGEIALEISGVRHRYQHKVVLGGVDMRIAAGRIHSLLGPNGAGKTTLLSLVAGLQRLQAGQVRLFGRIAALPDPGRRVALVGQETALFPNLTVRQNLEFFEALSPRGRASTDTVVVEARRVGLEPFLTRRVSSLSGGERRRLHFCSGLVFRAPVLLLDEPTVGADVETRQAVLQAVADEASSGTAICYTSHYLPEVEHLGGTVTILQDGLVRAEGSVGQVIKDHAETTLTLTFDGPAPQGVPGAVADGRHLRLRTPDPTGALYQLLPTVRGLGTLVDTKIGQPTLEEAYRNVLAAARSQP